MVTPQYPTLMEVTSMSHTRRGFRMSTTMQQHRQRCPHTLFALTLARCYLPPGRSIHEHLAAIAESSKWLDHPYDTFSNTKPHGDLQNQSYSSSKLSNHFTREHITHLYVTDPSAPRDERVLVYSSAEQNNAHNPNHPTQTTKTVGDSAPNDTNSVWTCSATVPGNATGLRALLRLTILDDAPMHPTHDRVRRLLIQHCAPRIATGPLTDECARRTALRTLSTRDRELLPLLLAGLSRPKIAHKLGLSVPSVRHRTAQIYATLGVHTRRELIEWWRSPTKPIHFSTTSLAA